MILPLTKGELSMSEKIEILKEEIFGIDRSVLHDSDIVTIHRISGLPVKIPLDRVKWRIKRDDIAAEFESDMDFLRISLEIGEDMQIIYTVEGIEKNVMDFADALGITTDIFRKEEKK